MITNDKLSAEKVATVSDDGRVFEFIAQDDEILQVLAQINDS